ncbi:DUF1003 domain-containing protein [Aquihabitans sp. G128]|uniref:DUF1003 domain-containing protein n=1 Tax=Aquihabitans sp. G128 TaxID=2849779 RepID=UPI001C2130EA|nr:DUF1003 domain-containing protein [Aquihabitans sp. G128]QXC59800.1 DUF1003 domain-containing protein [Aquihabitans sp. G128]
MKFPASSSPRDGDELSQPRRPGAFGRTYDPDAFGRFAEAIARTLGTGRFLVIQTIIVGAWITLNAFAWQLRWDKYPFILLNLAFSTQAAYAAPLILLAQNRQDDRDRAQSQDDRDVNARTQADTEYLARELSSVRLTLADVVTADDLRQAVDRVGQALEDLNERLDELLPAPTAEDRPDDGTPA